jgi:alkylated DNA repair protein (DNA oxidative demethylase)
MATDLFDRSDTGVTSRQEIGDGACILRGLALSREAELLASLDAVTSLAPFRRMVIPGGYAMSVSMTNCGAVGWVTDRRGYRYDANDPETAKPWPAMPEAFASLAASAAVECGYRGFAPDACLINRYEPGARLSLHQDKDESDFSHPIVSVSLGLPAVFQFGGAKRSDTVAKHTLRHGDVVVWGGRTRLNYHGVLALKEGEDARLGRARVNLTLRRAL